MINLTSSGGTITFAFDNNSGYLQNGTIEVPVNSLSLIVDESDMVTFKKANSNDVFVSALASDFGMTKAQLISFYKDNMVGSTGGGGITSGEVQTMIDESISGKADASAVTESINAAVSGKADAASAVTNVRILTVSQQNSLQIEQRRNNDYQLVGNVYKIGSGLTWDYTTKEIEVDNSTVALKSDVNGKADYSAATFVNEDETETTDFLERGMLNQSFDYDDGVYYFSGKTLYYNDYFWNLTVTLNDSSTGTPISVTLNTATGETDAYIFYKKSDSKELAVTAKGNYKIVGVSFQTDVLNEVEYTYKTKVAEEVAASTAIKDVIYPELESLEAAISGKAATSAVTAVNNVLTAHTADTTIHVTSADKTAWNAKSDFSGSYNDLTDKPTIPTVPTSNTAFTNDAGYITNDALSGYAESSAVTDEITAAVSGKQDTLSAGTGINITDNVISATGGGTTYTAGRGIDITNDTISVSLPISAGTGSNSVIEGSGTRAKGGDSHAEGTNTTASGTSSHAEGNNAKANGISSHAEGYSTNARGSYSHAEGSNTKTENSSEHASGQYNVSNWVNNTFGDSGNTLFSVGNGTSNNERHNAFEIRQNGDIYLSSGGTDIKLQDHLGSTVEVSSAITSGDTNAVAGGAVYDKFDEVEQVTARALNGLAEADEVAARALIDLNDKFGGLKLQKLTQAQYDALSGSTDSNTLYIIVN